MVARALFLVAVLSFGCGGSTASDATDASTTGDASATDSAKSDVALADVSPADYCTQAAARATKCGKTFDASSCAKQLACYQSAMKPADLDAVLSCLVTRDCTTSDDKCIASVATKYLTDPTVQDYVKACNDKRAACTTDAGAPYPDDYCGYDHGMIVDDAFKKLRACYDGPCADVNTCYDTVMASLGCK